jgi:hypothetical protein
MIDELLKARIKHSKKLCLKLEESDADCVIDLIETLQQLLINVVVGQSEQLKCEWDWNHGMMRKKGYASCKKCGLML